MLYEVQTMRDDDLGPSPSTTATQNEDAPNGPATRDIFIVHGHDSALKTQVARFLEKLKLNPIILAERPDKGRSIIEKFHDYSDVSFCIALFTPDDLGERQGKVNAVEDLTTRPRENVVFELGFFIGRLGRGNTVALRRNSVGLLSDYSGVLYITADTETDWHNPLIRELKAARFIIDVNLLFE